VFLDVYILPRVWMRVAVDFSIDSAFICWSWCFMADFLPTSLPDFSLISS
ncbi:DNA repair protein, putative, partial [Trypanosoma cruzi]